MISRIPELQPCTTLFLVWTQLGTKRMVWTQLGTKRNAQTMELHHKMVREHQYLLKERWTVFLAWFSSHSTYSQQGLYWVLVLVTHWVKHWSAVTSILHAYKNHYRSSLLQSGLLQQHKAVLHTEPLHSPKFSYVKCWLHSLYNTQQHSKSISVRFTPRNEHMITACREWYTFRGVLLSLWSVN
jgi:hypothetical protein